MSAKNLDRKNRWRNKTVAFRVSPEEDAQLETAVRLSGLTICEPANPSLPVPGGNPCTTLKYTSNVSGFRLAVRPVFYLKEGIKIIGSSDTDGSFEHPFRIELP